LIRGLARKTVRETALVTWLIAMSLATLEGMFATILPSFMEQASEHWLEVSFVRKLIAGVLGTGFQEATINVVAAAIAWSHPIVLAMLWTHAMMTCTRLPAGEVDRGTIDTLLGLPVSRLRLYLVDTAVPFVEGAFIVVMGVIGSLVGIGFMQSHLKFPTEALPIVTINLYAMFVFVAGAACLVSSLSSRRGRAIGILLAYLLASYVMHFLAPFWTFAQALAPVNLLSHYQPMNVLRTGDWPVGDIVALAGLGAAMWLAGAVVFVRRDICTV